MRIPAWELLVKVRKTPMALQSCNRAQSTTEVKSEQRNQKKLLGEPAKKRVCGTLRTTFATCTSTLALAAAAVCHAAIASKTRVSVCACVRVCSYSSSSRKGSNPDLESKIRSVLGKAIHLALNPTQELSSTRLPPVLPHRAHTPRHLGNSRVKHTCVRCAHNGLLEYRRRREMHRHMETQYTARTGVITTHSLEQSCLAEMLVVALDSGGGMQLLRLAEQLVVAAGKLGRVAWRRSSAKKARVGEGV